MTYHIMQLAGSARPGLESGNWDQGSWAVSVAMPSISSVTLDSVMCTVRVSE